MFKQLDARIACGNDDLKALVVFLAPDAKKSAASLETLAGGCSLDHIPLTMANNAHGPEDYRIADAAEVTILMWKGPTVRVNRAVSPRRIVRGRGEERAPRPGQSPEGLSPRLEANVLTTLADLPGLGTFSTASMARRDYPRRTDPGRMKIAELHADDLLDLESEESRDGPLGRRRRTLSCFSPFAAQLTTQLVFASIAALAIIVPPSRADEPSPEQVLREQGLVRSGVAYIFKDEEDLRDRIAEIGRQLARWKEEQAGLDERLETLSRLRLQHQEILKKLRSLENGRRPDAKEYRRPPFPDDGPRRPRFHATTAGFRAISTWGRAPSPSAGRHGRLRSRPAG